MKIAIIPARGGSKRIPRKNIKEFYGKPMIAWSIQAAIESGCFDRIFVSTEDTEITKVAKKYGAEVPFIRPANIADDHTGTIPVIAHAIDWFNKNHEKKATQVCCIYATAPFLRGNDIKNGLMVLQESGADYAFSVTSYSYPINRAIRITLNKRIEMIKPEYTNTRSQDLEKAYHDAGQFYWGKSEFWLEHKPMFSQNSSPVYLPPSKVQDIDTQEDWDRAELMFAEKMKR